MRHDQFISRGVRLGFHGCSPLFMKRGMKWPDPAWMGRHDRSRGEIGRRCLSSWESPSTRGSRPRAEILTYRGCKPPRALAGKIVFCGPRFIWGGPRSLGRRVGRKRLSRLFVRRFALRRPWRRRIRPVLCLALKRSGPSNGVSATDEPKGRIFCGGQVFDRLCPTSRRLEGDWVRLCVRDV